MEAKFGSVSSCTIRPRDLISEFASELRHLRGSLPRDLFDDIRRLRDCDGEDAHMVVDSLFDALNDYAPAYGYFGTHPGDGADYGFWLSEGWEQDARDNGALFVEDPGDIPTGYSGEVVHINDHGNVTLYIARSGKLREAWAVV